MNQPISPITISTALTILRIILSPFIAMAVVLSHWMIALLLFFVAAITDFFDGFLARLLNQATEFGARLDPVADKILVISSCLALLFAHQDIPLWFVLFIIGREIIVILGVALLLRYVDTIAIQPTWVSKLATALQLILIGYLILSHLTPTYYVPYITYALVHSATICILISLIQYIRIGWCLVRKG